MNVSIAEQETTVSFSRDEKTVKIWTSDSTMMTKLDKLVERDPKNWSSNEQKDKDGDVIAKEYLVQDKKLVSFRAGMSDEQKEKLRLAALQNFSNSTR